MSLNDVTIGIKLEADVKQFNALASSLGDIATALERINKTSANLGTALEQTAGAFQRLGSKEVVEATTNISNVIDMTARMQQRWDEQHKNLNKTTEESSSILDKLSEKINKTANEIANMGPTYLKTNDAIILAGQHYSALNKILDENKDHFSFLISAMEEYRGEADAGTKLLKDLEKSGISLTDSQKRIVSNFKELEEVAEKTGKSFREVAMSVLVYQTREEMVNKILETTGTNFSRLDPIQKSVVKHYDDLYKALGSTESANETLNRGILEGHDIMNSYLASLELYKRAIDMALVPGIAKSANAMEFITTATKLSKEQIEALSLVTEDLEKRRIVARLDPIQQSVMESWDILSKSMADTGLSNEAFMKGMSDSAKVLNNHKAVTQSYANVLLSALSPAILKNAEHMEFVSRVTGMTKEQLESLANISDEIEKRRIITRLDPIQQVVIQSYNDLANRMGVVGLSNDQLVKGMLEARNVVEQQRLINNEYAIALQSIMSPAILENAEAMTYASAVTGFSTDEIKKIATASEEWYQVQAKLAMINKLQNMRLQEFYAQLGPMYNAIYDLTQAGLWWGLTVMFSSMTMSRYNRTATATISSSQSLRRAMVAEAQARMELNKAIEESGANSLTAIQAQWKLEESQIAVKTAQENLKQAYIQNTFAAAQWIFGTVPSSIAAGFRMAQTIYLLTYLRQKDTAETLTNATANEVASKSVNILGGSVVGLTAKLLALSVGLSLATMGLSVVIGMIAQAWAQADLDREIAKITAEVKKFTKAIEEADYALWGGSLGPDMLRVGKIAIATRKSISNLVSSTEDLVTVTRSYDISNIADNVLKPKSVTVEENIVPKLQTKVIEVEEKVVPTLATKTIEVEEKVVPKLETKTLELEGKVTPVLETTPLKLEPLLLPMVLAGSIAEAITSSLLNVEIELKMLQLVSGIHDLLEKFVTEATTKGTIYVESKNEIPFETSSGNNVTVVVSGNEFTVRDEVDIDKIAERISEITIRKIYATRGRY